MVIYGTDSVITEMLSKLGIEDLGSVAGVRIDFKPDRPATITIQ